MTTYSGLGTTVELQIGGAWTDITDDVYLRNLITIGRGRADEGSQVDPGSCTLTLNNKSGKYSPRNPLSPYYGLIGRNTPVRVSVPASGTYALLPGLDDETATITTHDDAALDITGDIDIRLDAELDVWSWYAPHAIELAGKYLTTGNQRSWGLTSNPVSGGLTFNWSADGAAAVAYSGTQPLPVPASDRQAIRVTLDVNNGLGGYTLTFYTADTISGPWTQLEQTVTTAGTTSLFNSSAPLELGNLTSIAYATSGFQPARGKLLAFELRNGINGTVVASPDFTAQAVGATSFTDGAGRIWSLTGDTELTNRATRFVGEISAWPPRWDVSGQDIYVSVQAAGILRRLGQGSSPLQSTLRRRIPSYGPLAYWPMEDGAAATQAYSPITGVSPMRTSGLTFASDNSLAGSDALPAFGATSSISGTVPAPAATQTSWHTEFVVKISAAPTSRSTVMRYLSSGTVVAWSLQLESGLAHILGIASDDTVIVDQAVTVGSDLYDGRWNRWQFVATQNGGTVTWSMLWVNVGGNGGNFSSSYTGTLGRITAVASAPSSSALNGAVLGHVAVFSPSQTVAYNNADTGFLGETAGVRMDRLATEENLLLAVSATASEDEQMGPQLPATLLSLLQDAADADGGILYEQREVIGLAYRDRISLYNQIPTLILDYPTRGHVAPPLEPTDDDQAARNDITITRTGGSSARVTQDTGPLSTQEPPDGVGAYADSLTLNLATDDQPEQIASWQVHLGTWDEARYPTVHVNLAAGPQLIPDAATTDVGDRLQITNPPPWLPPDTIDLLVQGYTETIGIWTWDITYNCTPAGPWSSVAVADDPDLGRADTDGSQLAASAAATALTLSVTTTSGPRWADSATYPSDFPLSIRVGGEVMTVTAITGTGATQAFTVVRSANGIVKAQAAGTAVSLANPGYVAL